MKTWENCNRTLFLLPHLGNRKGVLLQFFQVFILSSLQYRQKFSLYQHKSTSASLVRVPVAEALPLVAEALPPGCGGSAHFLQKQSQLLILGLEFDKKSPIFLSHCKSSREIKTEGNVKGKSNYHAQRTLQRKKDYKGRMK